METNDRYRRPWHCDIVGTFAHRTCVERWPSLLGGIADDVPRHRAALHALRDEVARGIVRNVAADHPERARWSAVEAFVGRPWTALPWYVGESFLYARVREAVRFHETREDPFVAAKLREERALASAHDDDDGAVVDDEARRPADAGAAHDALAASLWRSLWGNRADLSLREAMQHTHTDASDLVVDERAAAVALLAHARVVGILLDNAGAELASDLALARLLRRRGVEVTLFAKDAPFFVSDATPDDIARLAARGHATGGAAVVVDAFFTGPAFLTRGSLRDEAAASTKEHLTRCDVVVAKGDCNYRRLTRDRPFSDDDGAAFAEVVDFPVPLVSLRTLKAEVLVGATAAAVARARSVDASWLTSGRFGVVQVALPDGRI